MAVIELTKKFSGTPNLPARGVGIRSGANRVVPPDSRGLLDLSKGNVFLADGVITNYPAAERFRILRSEIERKNRRQKKYQTLAVLSAIPQEGKSVVAVNLARALSVDPTGRTLLIDVDLRRPSVHEYFDLPVEDGVSDVLGGRLELGDAIRPVSAGLDVLTAGTIVEDPTRLVESPEFLKHLNDLRNFYNYIVLDCPPVLLCPEPITVSSLADGSMYVCRAWKTDKRMVRDAVNIIGKKNLMGVVMNGGYDSSKSYLDSDRYGYYGQSALEKRQATSV